MSRRVATLVYSKQAGSMARKAVLAYFADRASDDGTGIWTAKQRIADEIECSKQTVITTVKSLIADGLVAETGKRSNSNGYTVEYAIILAAVEALPDSKQALEGVQIWTGQNPDGSSSLTPRGQAALPKPSRNRPPQKAKKLSSDKRASKPKFVLPEGIEPEDWAGFEEMRRRIGKPMTDHAKHLALKRLAKLAEDGWPPGDVLNNSTLNSYQGLFPPKDDRNGLSRQSNPHQAGIGRTVAAAQSVIADIRAARARTG